MRSLEAKCSTSVHQRAAAAAPACSDRSSVGIPNWGHTELLAFGTGGAIGP